MDGLLKTRRKRGRKPHTLADRELMAQVSKEFRRTMEEKDWSAEEAACSLGVSRASFYNYLAKRDLPRMEVLRRAHGKWKLDFNYGSYVLDDQFFETQVAKPGAVKETQIPLPFIQGLRNEDIEVLAVIPRKPNAVDVSLRIRFAGNPTSA
jgi:transcriptional regulator with XRE-family HTH domain